MVEKNYRLGSSTLVSVLHGWDDLLTGRVLLIACGGTALTLMGIKETTKDIDFLVPRDSEFRQLLACLSDNGYARVTGNGWKHPESLYIFEFFGGSRVFQTDLLDPVEDPDRHVVIDEMKQVILARLQADDLVISKMFRGTDVDVQDCMLLIKQGNLDLMTLFGRYKETASFYYNPPICKTHFQYLLDAMQQAAVDTSTLQEAMSTWTP